MGDDEALTQFEGYLLAEQRVSVNTFLAYKRDMQQFVRFMRSKKVALASVVTDDIRSFLRHLHGKRLTASTIARKISSLKAFYVYLSSRINVTDFSDILRAPKMEKRLPKYLSEEEVRAVFVSIEMASEPKDIRNKVMFHLLYVSGMRVSELVSLRLSNIHANGLLISVQGKGGKERLVPIVSIVAEILCTYIATLTGQHKGNKEQFLFPVIYNNKIKHLSRQSFWMILKEMCKKAGINRMVSPHQLRHSFATHMLTHGADLRSLQLLLGHENLTTVQIYTHVDTSHLRIIYDKKHPRS